LLYFFLDIPAAYYFKSLGGRHEWLIRISEQFTKLGYSAFYLVPSFLAFLLFRLVVKRDRYAAIALFLFLSIAISGLTADLIKVLVARYRPGMLFSSGLYGFAFLKTGYKVASFPSGHASTVAALAASLWIVWRTGGYLCIPIGMLGAASRVVLGVHFPSDVLAGAYIGVIVTVIVAQVLQGRGLPVFPHGGDPAGPQAAPRLGSVPSHIH
jgi:membrane-associated phospholipid phosphatase